MAELADNKPEGWGGRPEGGDAGRPAGTSGAPKGTNGAGTSGWRTLRNAYLAIGVVIALVAGVNVMTILDDARRIGEQLPVSVPIVLEVTSGVATYLACGVIYAAIRWAPPDRRQWVQTLAIHLGASLAFSGLHVGLMELFRWAVFAGLGVVHRWSPAEWPYEYRKDLISYLALAFTFWVFTRPAPVVVEPATQSSSATFDIKDGATTRRTPVGAILAARAAGNYVEFVLEGGGRPLMRASLQEIETALAPHGLVRTHRSWLVNERRIRALVAAGSGDFRLDLDGGVSVPLSRRFPEALARLRGGG
jgi:hypothetical protein